MKKTPGTSLSVLIVWCFMGYATFVTLPLLARAEDVSVQAKDLKNIKESSDQLARSVAVLNTRLLYDGMRRNLDQIDKEIFEVDREISRTSASGGDAPNYLYDRKRDLSSRRSDLQRRLDSLIQQNPGLVYE